MTVWKITTSNGAFWQIHDVCARTENRAVELAESEIGANDLRILREEERAAACIGEEAAGRYAACRIERLEDAPDGDDEEVFFCDAGPEG